MLPTPQLSIAACWPSHPSVSAFVFYYILSQWSILSAHLTDSMAYKYNYKDTVYFPDTLIQMCIKTSTFVWLRHLLNTSTSLSLVFAYFVHWFWFATQCLYRYVVETQDLVNRYFIWLLLTAGIAGPLDCVLAKWVWLLCDFAGFCGWKYGVMS